MAAASPLLSCWIRQPPAGGESLTPGRGGVLPHHRTALGSLPRVRKEQPPRGAAIWCCAESDSLHTSKRSSAATGTCCMGTCMRELKTTVMEAFRRTICQASLNFKTRPMFISSTHSLTPPFTAAAGAEPLCVQGSQSSTVASCVRRERRRQWSWC